MRTKRVPPLQIASFFAIICTILFSSMVAGQTTYQVNGRSLIILNGEYHDITSPDTDKDEWLPGAISRNILHAAGYMEYTEPINLNISLKATEVINSGSSKNSNIKLQNSGLEVYPNPASEYCIVRYTCRSEGNNLLQITNLQGQLVESIPLKGISNSVVASLKKYTAGTYLISLVNNGKTVQKIQLIIK